MKTPARSEAGLEAPLPLAQFKRFIAVFHFVFIAGIAFMLLLRWQRPGLSWGWRDMVLAGLVVVQIGLYLLFMVMLWKPPEATRWWVGYFVAGYAIWLAEWSLEPTLQWTAWAYLGQMFGVLRPGISVPMAMGVFVTWLAVKTGFQGLARMTFFEWVGNSILVITATGLGLFLYRLTVTSTERAKLIRSLERAQTELEASRQRESELAVFRERERLARDLHDSLGHGLATLTVQLEAAQRLYAVDPARASALLDQMKDLTRSSMEQLRRALAGLRAPGLGEQALIPAVRALSEEVGVRAGLNITCSLPEQTQELPPILAEAIWRVVQESLTNIQKHAHASSAEVSLTLQPWQISLRVADDGVGMPVNGESKPGHYGIRGLRERIEGLGGFLAVGPAVSKGTLVQAEIPLLPK